jgi:hypothetical protein
MSTYEEDEQDARELAETLADWPTADKTIEALRAIVNDHAAKVIDGVLIDAWTAKAIVTVYDACDDEKRAIYMGLPIAKMGTMAWKLVRVK